MTSHVLEQFAKRSRQLYSLPAVAMQVVELTNQPAIDTTALKQCIENDPALATKILRVVNSSLFGLSQQVADLNQALALVGTKPLKLLVLGFSLPNELLADLEVGVLKRYWRRTLIKAVAARELAETLWEMPGDEAFIAGLLQDLGMLVLIQDLGEIYLKFLEKIYHDGGDLAALETATLGFDHASLSARLLEHWGLPDWIVRGVGQPFDVETLIRLPENEQAVPQILHLADLVAEFLTREQIGSLDTLIGVSSFYRGISIDELESVVASLELKVPQLADVLSLTLPEEIAYSTVLLQAYVQLCDAAEAGSLELLREQRMDGGTDASEFTDLLQQSRTLCDEIGKFTELHRDNRPVKGPGRQDAALETRAGSPAEGHFATAMTLPHVPAPALLASVEAAVQACRQARHAISLALLELDQGESVTRQLGAAQVHRALDRLQSIMTAIVDDEGHVMRVDDYRFAVLFEKLDRHPAVELTRQLVRCVGKWSAEQPATRGHALSLSGGVATLAMPPKNFPCQEMIDAAERCLHGVQLSGGDSVKSIDIY